MIATRSKDLSPGSSEWLLAFADDEHMIGARHAAWIGLGPFLEEDLAFCSIAQDELGHAIALYEFLSDDVDRFALLRQPTEYRSAWLTELPCDHWDQALTRHWLYDTAEQLRWQSLAESSNDALSALAARAEREEAFHRQHADLFLTRLAQMAMKRAGNASPLASTICSRSLRLSGNQSAAKLRPSPMG